MLDVTPAASQAIGTLTAVVGRGEGGLRIAVTAKVSEGAEITLAYSDRPEHGDQVVATAPGSHVFLESDAARYLADKVLDVRQSHDGSLHFAVDKKH
jgi:iron-sulfur cluster assembly protein